jgi:hypothetical protein
MKQKMTFEGPFLVITIIILKSSSQYQNYLKREKTQNFIVVPYFVILLFRPLKGKFKNESHVKILIRHTQIPPKCERNF